MPVITWTIFGHRLFSYDRLESGNVHCKVLMLGDEGTGKTTLVEAIGAQMVEHNSENNYQNYAMYKSSCDIPKSPAVQMEIWDFSGTCSWQMKELPPDVDFILLCLDVCRPETHDSVINKWIRIVREVYGFDVGIILVGCKSDMRSDLETISRLSEKRQTPVTYHQASLTTNLIGAFAYIETSKRCKQTIHQIFEVVALKHIGKLTNKHLVFRRQRTIEKHRHSSTSSVKSDSSTGNNGLLKVPCCLSS